MDSLHFELKENLQEFNFKTLELDYSDIVKQKINFISKSDKVKDVIKENFIISEDKKNLTSQNYSIFDCDLINVKALENILEKSNLCKSDLTIIVAECLLCYLESTDIINLLKFFNDYFENVVLVYYDLIHFDDVFGKVMVNNLKNIRGIILPSFQETRSENDQLERMKKSGFNFYNKCVDMLDYYMNILDKKELKRINSLEFVDELEEFNLLMKHSCLGISIKTKDENIKESLSFLIDYNIK